MIGFNQVYVEEDELYKKGTMVLLENIGGVVSISDKYPVTYCDYEIEGDEEAGDFNLVDIDAFPLSRWYFQLVVFTKRYAFQTTLQQVSQYFDTPGTYNLTVTVYNPATRIVYLKSLFNIVGNYIYFISYLII